MKKSIKMFALVSLVLMLAACSAGMPTGEGADTPTPVRVSLVQAGQLTQNTEIIGLTKAHQQVSIMPQVSAKLLDLHVKEGDSVTEGQLLAELDNKDLRTALELEQATLGLNQNQLASAQSRMKQVEASAKEAIVQAGKIDDQLEENINQARLAVEQAQLNVDAASIRVRQATSRLEDTSIYAPVSGSILSIGAVKNEMVGMQAPLFTIVTIDPLIVEAQVSAEQLHLLAVGEERTVHFSTTGENKPGIVDSVSPVANQSGLYPVTLKVANEEGEIRPGIPAKVLVPRVLADDTLLVPTDAVVEQGGEAYLYKVVDGTAQRVELTILHALTDLTAVQGELQDGDQVITRGQLTITDGKSVNIVEEGA
ncbi:efflux RND transporter periplasmic adaptor subunit [Xylanibacillus composti]|uniref:RND transporter n=1 Tax=Xylanibacillus composti TaxID=1572762 RepID=A0A8J4H328_9BACL|nr:efflux RND transporter periplasmic adaptor subunit [Xylanibacillus composti]MDT9723403.1 efflux RND transporter periplasmic adaptor subunit [Xylanibacillus composti]GIQ68562.1 RND transporter [Xylanibacillus composti]